MNFINCYKLRSAQRGEDYLHHTMPLQCRARSFPPGISRVNQSSDIGLLVSNYWPTFQLYKKVCRLKTKAITHFSQFQFSAIAIIIDDEVLETWNNIKNRRMGLHLPWRKQGFEGVRNDLQRINSNGIKFLRLSTMSNDCFRISLEEVESDQKKPNSRFQKPISLIQRLAVFLGWILNHNFKKCFREIRE